MGINIYTITKGKPTTYEGIDGKSYKNYEDKHIGKRYAAGVWCWDCKVPLHDDVYMKDRLLEECPSCGKKRGSRDDRGYNPAMRELGYDDSKPYKPTGIDGASGFIWCIDKRYGLGTNKKEIMEKVEKYEYVIDEYGRKMTIQEFKDMFLQVIEEKFSDGEFS